MTFQPRILSSGRICCSSEAVLCDTCTALFASTHQQERHMHSYDAPDPYAQPIAAMRAAAEAATSETPEQAFARRWANMRSRQCQLEREADEDHTAEHLRTLTAHHREIEEHAPLSNYASPDPYAVALKGSSR